MEFDEIMKMWDAQRNETIYTINEKAMHRHIQSRKQSARHIANFSEVMLIVVNLCAGIFVVVTKLAEINFFLYTMATFMLITAGYVWVGRQRRLKRESNFASSMLTDLDHAIANARYQVTLSQTMRWYGLLICFLSIISLWQSEKAVGIIIGAIAFFSVVFFASRWEHNWYVRRQRSLESLRNKLVDDNVSAQ